MLFSAASLICEGVTSTQSLAGVLVVDGAQTITNAGCFRILVYSPSGVALSNAVNCELTFRARTNALNGRVTLRDGVTVFGDHQATGIAGTINQGLILVGDAFGVFPAGGRAQFRAPEGSQQIILGSSDLTHWTPLSTNTAQDGLVFLMDPGTPAAPMQQFYRAQEISGPGS